MPVDKDSKIERTLLLIWVTVILIVGILTVHDFGISFDEPSYYLYAEKSLDSYRSFFSILYEPDYGPGKLRFYGPLFIVLVELVVRVLRLFSVSILRVDIWHFSYFIIFHLTGLSLYSLAKRWFSRWTAWAVLILFATQPLLWGHAFMNPKDIPFMAFMVFSVFAGFRMIDSFGESDSEASLQNPMRNFSEAWKQIEHGTRKKYIRLLFIGIVILLLSGVFKYLIAQIVAYFYAADPNSSAGKFFHRFAQASNIPLENYVSRAQTLFKYVEYSILGLGLFALIVYLGYLLAKTSKCAAFLDSQKQFMQGVLASMRHLPLSIKNAFKPINLLEFVRQIFQAVRSRMVIFAGIILGLTISVRVLGPLAGLTVILYLLIKVRQRALPVIIAYLLWAGVATYLTWPYLWISPVNKYIESLTLMSNFPWPGQVLFNKHFYPTNRLPYGYLPVLLNIQFTEPLLISFYFGFVVMLWNLFRKKVRVDLLIFVSLSFIIPLLLLIGLRKPLYDNFRQILFILPGAFLIAGFMLEVFLNRLRSNWMRVVLIVMLALPGIYSGLELHPYEYVYYNSFVGGTQGAAGRFEMDYWRTSYRELALQVNQLASKDASVFVSGLPYSFTLYARPDLTIEYKIDPGVSYHFEYAALTSRWNSDQRMFPDADVVLSVERDGAVLAVLKYVKDQAVK
jgi:hypothetical protein